MVRVPLLTRSLVAAVFAGLLTVALAAPAYGSSPQPGKLYTGYTSASAYHNISPPVSFTVSNNAAKLLRFKWAGGGCIGLGGPGDPFASAQMNYKVGTIRVASNGTFSVKNVRWTYTGTQAGVPFTKVTISSVSGRFTKASKATGTISFSQKLTTSCTGKVDFTAAAGPASGAFRKTSPANHASDQTASPGITWSSSRNAPGYKYCVDTSDNDTCNSSWLATGNRTHATLGGLKAGDTYYWQVIATSVHGTVAADSGNWHSFAVAGSKPEAGTWRSLRLGGSVGGGFVQVTGISFTVSPAGVANFGFSYEYANGICGSGSGSSIPNQSRRRRSPAGSSHRRAVRPGSGRGTVPARSRAPSTPRPQRTGPRRSTGR